MFQFSRLLRITARDAWCVGLSLLAPSLAGCGTSITVADEQQKRDDVLPQDGTLEGGVPEDGGGPCGARSEVIGGTTVILKGCTLDSDASACGVVVGVVCVPLGQEGRLDPTCPPLSQTPSLPGCCTPLGVCGVMEQQIGFGCTQVPFLSQFVSQFVDCKY